MIEFSLTEGNSLCNVGSRLGDITGVSNVSITIPYQFLNICHVPTLYACYELG